MYLNYLALPNIFCVLFLLGLSVFILVKKPNITTTIFTSLMLSAAIWQAGTSLTLLSKNPIMAFVWIKITYIGVTFIPVTLFHFVVSFIDHKKAKYYVLLNYLIAIGIILPLSWMGIFLNGVNKFNWGYWFKATAFHPIYILWYSTLFFVSLYLLYLTYKNNKINKHLREQIKYLLVALCISYGGVIDFMPDYGANIYPIGYLFVVSCLAIIAYSILQHHLMEINVVLRKSIIYSIFVALFALIYFILMKYSSLLIVGGVVQPPLKIASSLFALFAFILHGLLGFIVLFNNPKKSVNRLFSSLSFVISFWILWCFVESIQINYHYALLADLLLNKAAVIAPALFLHTYYEILNIKNRTIITISYIMSLVLLLLTFTGLFSKGVLYSYGARYLTIPGHLYYSQY